MEKVFEVADLGRSVDRESGELQRAAKLSVLNLPEGEGITLGNALRRVLLGQIGGTEFWDSGLKALITNSWFLKA